MCVCVCVWKSAPTSGSTGGAETSESRPNLGYRWSVTSEVGKPDRTPTEKNREGHAGARSAASREAAVPSSPSEMKTRSNCARPGWSQMWERERQCAGARYLLRRPVAPDQAMQLLKCAEDIRPTPGEGQRVERRPALGRVAEDDVVDRGLPPRALLQSEAAAADLMDHIGHRAGLIQNDHQRALRFGPRGHGRHGRGVTNQRLTSEGGAYKEDAEGRPCPLQAPQHTAVIGEFIIAGGQAGFMGYRGGVS